MHVGEELQELGAVTAAVFALCGRGTRVQSDGRKRKVRTTDASPSHACGEQLIQVLKLKHSVKLVQ